MTITRIEALTRAINKLDVESEEFEVLSNMKKQLEKRKNAPRSKTNARIANEVAARKLADMVSLGDSIGTAFVIDKTEAMTPQKVVGIMSVACELGLFEKTHNGKKVEYIRL